MRDGCRRHRVSRLRVVHLDGNGNRPLKNSARQPRKGVDQDECSDRRDRALVDPCVHGATLDDDVAGLQMDDLATMSNRLSSEDAWGHTGVILRQKEPRRRDFLGDN